jgi:hypothetical protein
MESDLLLQWLILLLLWDKKGIFYSVLQYVGTAADAAKYKYKL